MVKTVLFDVDGVLLSEERYFDMSALTVWEVLYSSKYMGLRPDKFKADPADEEIEKIRRDVFVDDQVLKLIKAGGVNANWDMIYLTASYQILYLLEQAKGELGCSLEKWLKNEIDRSVLMEIGNTLSGKDISIDFTAFLDDFANAELSKKGLMDHLDHLAKEKLGIETTMFGKMNELWYTCEHASQEWYVGDKHIIQSTGKPSVQTGKAGFMSDEKVLADKESVGELFYTLSKSGVRIGIGTGRPELETIEPFRALGWLDYFDINNIVTADDVLRAERSFPEHAPLSKPHPFTYIKALSCKQKSDQECLNEKLPVENGEETLIVGDSLADLIAAKEMGCLFAAVLTGLSGQEARAEFEEHQADYILDGVLGVKEVVQSMTK
ncbi:HAD family hydrolase [Siminovitchia sediminis]|uniref:HAD family hydrolase n=1 Tax=Siminovitchia sediminis TaxID=1274353 RepID=A0ABW4KK57_9BACI